MDSTIKVTCFTDLKEFTQLTDQLGQDGIRPFLEDYLRVGKLLAESVGGKYIKSIGDAHMITFDTLEPALNFAVQLQQYYLPQPCQKRGPLQIRIALYLGVVEPCGDDVFGSGPNQASRVEGLAIPGEVWVNEWLVKAFEDIWPPYKMKYFKFCGEFGLKGIKNPPKQKLFSFDWYTLSGDDPNVGLAPLILEHLKNASVVISNFSINDVANPASIIWPVVPRNVVNAIHRGQVEIIRLLTLLGWKVHVLLADCGTKDTPRHESEEFMRLVNKYMAQRDLRDINFSFMSELYKPQSKHCYAMHEYFQKVITDFTLEELISINNKDYTVTEKEKIMKSPTLDFLRPALEVGAVLRLSPELEGKSVVVVGHDEKTQWERGLDIKGSMSRFGVIFNPIFETERYQVRQEKTMPFWYSWEAMVEDMQKSNLAQWTTQLHAYLPEFPSKCVTIEGRSIYPEDWQNEEKLHHKITREALAEYVFKKILSI